MAPSATPPKSTLRSRLHMRPSTSMKVSRVAIFALLALISAQTVGSTLLWYAGKIRADSSSRVVTTGAASSVTTSGATLSGTYDYPTDVTQRGFQYGLTTGYGSQVVDDSVMTYVDAGILSGVDTSSGSSGYATDSAGNLYLTHFDGHTSASVQKYSASGTLVSEFGSQGAGDGQFDTPQDVALDTSGNIYVADTGNTRVQKLDSTGGYVSQFDPLEQGSGENIVVTRVSLDNLGNIYVFGHWDSDPGISNNWQPVFQKYNASGVFQTQLINSSGTATNQLYTYAQNTDLTTDTSNNLYITDGYNHRVLKYDSSGNFLAQWGTTGVASSAPGQFNVPTGIARGPGGQLYISDGGNDRVQIISPAGDYVQSWSDNQIGFPLNLTVSLNGKVYAQSWGGAGGLVVGTPSINANVTSLQCDTTYHYRALTTDADSTEYGADATFTTDACTGLRNITTLPADNVGLVGATLHGSTDYPQGITARGFQYGLTTSYGSSVADSSALSASFGSKLQGALGGNSAIDIAVDSSGFKYIAYQFDHVVRKYDALNNLVLEWGTEGTGDGQFQTLTGIGVGPDDYIYTTEYTQGGSPTTNRVQKFDTTGSFVTKWGVPGSGNGQFTTPKDVAVSQSNEVYVVDYDSVQKFNSSGGFIAKWGAAGSGDGQFSDASGIALALDGAVYVSDRSNARIQKFDSNGTFLLKWGQAGDLGNSEFIAPERVGVDGLGNVYVLDYSSGPLRLQKFDANGSFLSRFGGDFYFGTGLSVTQSGQVYTVDASSTTDYYTYGIDATISSLTCGTTYHYRSYVADRGGTQYGDDATFTTSACPPLNITTTSLDDGVVGVSYSDLVTVDNLQGGETYSISSGSLPPGLSIDSSTGYITGMPGQSGAFNFDVTVENAGSSDTAFLTINVAEFANPLSITTLSLPDAQAGVSYQEYVYTSDSVSDVSFSVVSGSLPDGLSLTSYGTSGVVYGTPTTPGTYSVTLQGQDSRGVGAGTDTQDFTITVAATNIRITTTTVPPGRVGASYDSTIEYTDANATPVFSLASGSLPPGVSLTLQGYLQGTPTQEGTYNFTVQADDGLSTDTQALSLVVLPALANVDNSPLVTITSPGDNSTFPGGASTITGTGPPNQTISIFIDGTQVGTTAATAQGTWSYQASGIAAGSHTLDAKWVPGAEIMFISVVDSVQMRTVVKVYDTLNDVLVKEIALPDNSFGMNITASTTGILVAGVDMSSGLAKVWLINLNSADVTGIPSDDSINASVFSADGGTLHSVGVRGTYIRTNMNTFETQAIDLWENESHYTTIQLSEDGSRAYIGTIQAAVGPVNPSTVTSEQRTRLGVIYEVDTSSGALINSFNTVDNSNLDELEYSTGLAIVGNTAYVPVVRRTATDTPGTTAESYIKLYNVSTRQFIRQINVSSLSESSTMLALGGYVDVSNNKLYFHGRSISDGVAESIIKLNILDDAISITPLTVSEGTTYPVGWGIDSGGNGSKLYTPRNIVADGVLQAYIEVMNLATGNLFSTSGYPINVGNTSSYAVQIGSSFSAIITPPKDSIAFSVTADNPDCLATGTCPTSCITTNTCTPQSCTVTNTCPVVPPVVQPPSPATVGTSNPKAPKIITTPFPPASPTASRLGWFDRGILAVARFVPTQAAIGFPYLLFLLLLIFALSLYYQSSNEVRKDKLNRDFIAKRKSIRAQQDNFIALASHYLNTPITIIQNSIEVMGERGPGPKGK